MYRKLLNLYSEYESIFNESGSQNSDSRHDASTESEFDLLKIYTKILVII